MSKPEVLPIVLEAIEMANNARPEDKKIPVSDSTELFGEGGQLDSMELVGLLMDIEDALLEQDVEVSLSDERAMSQKRSPFRSVQTLVTYIDDLIAEGQQ